MPNDSEHSYSTFVHLMKTTKQINDVLNKVSDRLIITHEGRLYFDWCEDERIEITSKPESYRYKNEFGELNSTKVILYSDLYDFSGNSLDNGEKIVTAYTPVYDSKGSMGIITSIDSQNKMCDVLVLTNSISKDALDKLINELTIYRCIYN